MDRSTDSLEREKKEGEREAERRSIYTRGLDEPHT